MCQGLWLRKRVSSDQFGQLWPIWRVNCRQHYFQWKYLNSDWYYIEVCFKGIIYNKSALGQLIAWYRASDKPLYEPMLTQPLTHIYAALWGNVLKENRFIKDRQKSLFAHINKENNMNSSNNKSFIIYHTIRTQTGVHNSIWLNKTSLTIDDHLLWLG